RRAVFAVAPAAVARSASALRSRRSQPPFAAAVRSRRSQPPFAAAVRSRRSQPPFATAVLLNLPLRLPRISSDDPRQAVSEIAIERSLNTAELGGASSSMKPRTSRGRRAGETGESRPAALVFFIPLRESRYGSARQATSGAGPRRTPGVPRLR